MKKRAPVADTLTALSFVVATALPSLQGAAATPPSPADPTAIAAMHARIFTDDDGLPQNSIESLRFSPDGMLWATTREGGARFDGTEWTPLSMPSRAGNNWPRIALPSHDGAVWFGTEGGGLHRFLHGKWASVSDGTIEHDTVLALAETTSPRLGAAIWAGSSSGLFRIDPGTMRVSRITALGGTSITALYATPSSLLAGSANGAVFRCEANRCLPDSLLSELAPGARIAGFAETEDSDGARTTWIATDRGIAVSSPAGSRLELPGTRINAITLTHDSRGETTPWIALDGAGVLRRVGGQWSAPTVAPGLPNGFVFSFAPYPVTGPTRHLFAGTLNGVVRIDVAAWRSIDVDAGLPDSSVVSILEARVGTGSEYLLGTTAGLASLDGGAWRRVDERALSSAPVFALLQSRDGTSIWAGTNEGLLTRRDGRWSEESATSALPRAAVVSLMETSDPEGRRLWAGTYGSGLWSRVGNGDWTPVEGLPDGRVEALVADERDGKPLRVWVATNRGLVSIEGHRVTVIDRDAGLPAGIIRSLQLAEGPDGKTYLWAGTATGLSWREAGNDQGRWQTLSRATGALLPGDNVYQVRCESPTRFWLFTGRGIVRLTFPPGAPATPASATIESFTTADGLPGNECNFGASLIDTSGRVWAGTTRGAAIFDPSIATDDRIPKTIAFTEARALQANLPIDAKRALRHDQSDVLFAYRLLDPGRGDRALYRTQLVGSEKSPGEWGRAAERRFTGLPPGRYTFRVWGRDAGGNVSGPLELQFAVVAPPWRSWWAMLVYIGVAIAGLATIHRIRVRTISAHAERLERVVRSRTRDLERMNRELGIANAALADMSVTDPLTGARNRRFLDQEMQREADRVGRTLRSGDDLMFFVVDIDRFKNVNDSYGHTVGDAILRQFCGTLAAAVRETDTIVRWGGEEFLVVARRSSRAEATRIADRIIETVRAEVFDAFDGRMVQLSCSLGWAVFPFVPRDPGLFTWNEVVDIADHCLLAAKASGRNCWVGLSAGPSLSADTFFQRLRRSVPTMTDAAEVEVTTSLANPAATIWP